FSQCFFTFGALFPSGRCPEQHSKRPLSYSLLAGMLVVPTRRQPVIVYLVAVRQPHGFPTTGTLRYAIHTVNPCIRLARQRSFADFASLRYGLPICVSAACLGLIGGKPYPSGPAVAITVNQLAGLKRLFASIAAARFPVSNGNTISATKVEQPRAS